MPGYRSGGIERRSGERGGCRRSSGGIQVCKKCYAGNAEKGWKQGKCGSAGKKQRRNVKKWRTKIWQNQN